MQKYPISFEDDEENEPILCVGCEKQIPMISYDLHVEKCKERKENKQKLIMTKTEIGELKRKRLKIKEQKRKEEEESKLEKIPCSFCGYQMSLEELDTHPNNCVAQGGRCEYCNEEYPNELMEDHYQVCTERMALANQNESQQQQEYQSHEERDPQSAEQVLHRLNQFIRLIELLRDLQGQSQNKGFSEEELKSLKITKYKNIVGKDPQMCTICFCQAEQNQDVIELPCKHLYHPDCIKKWLESSNYCPNCKKDLKENKQK